MVKRNKFLIISSLLCLTYSVLTPRSRVLFENLTGFQPVKKFHTFHGTRKFIIYIIIYCIYIIMYYIYANFNMSQHSEIHSSRKSNCIACYCLWFLLCVGFCHIAGLVVIVLCSCAICFVVCLLCWLLLTLVFLLFQVSVRRCYSPPLAAN